MKEITKTVLNKTFAKTALLGLLLIPAFIFVYDAGMIEGGSSVLIISCIITGACSLFPTLVQKVSYNELTAGFYILLSHSIILTIVAYLMGIMPAVRLLLFVPVIVSLLYHHRDLTFGLSILTLIALILIELNILRNEYSTVTEFSTYIREVYLYLLKEGTVYAVILLIIIIEAGASQRMREELERKLKELPRTYVRDYEKEDDDENAFFKNQKFFDVEYLFSEIEKDMISLIGDRDKTFTLEIDEDLPIMLLANADKIKEAVSCICSDLLMYHRRGSVKLNVGFDKNASPVKGQMLKLEIFISSNSDIAAVGYNKKVLGAYITKQIVEKLSGSFEDHSTEQEIAYRLNVFAKIESAISIRERREKNELALREAGRDPKVAGRKEFDENTRILITDDNKEVCKLLDAVLSGMGAKCTIAESGNEALFLLSKEKYDMMFIDQMMPDKSGEETVRELRSSKDNANIHIPVVLLSVNVNDEAMIQYKAAGFNDCIQKPMREADIRMKAQEYLVVGLRGGTDD